jgi:predicted site-specific integrase-resolvase
LISKNGKTYNTIADAAQSLGVSRKSLRRYIDEGIVSRPERIPHGKQHIEVFAENYLKKAGKELDDYRNNKGG